MIKMMVDIDIKDLPAKIDYRDKIMMVGSCFTEHIGDTLNDLKFQVLQNPHGILFDPLSVCNSLVSYVENRSYSATDLVFLNEVWTSWEHHGRFSGTDQREVLEKINTSQRQAHDFLRQAGWLVVTLGSAFSYRLSESGRAVANCHRAPAQSFEKNLMTIDAIISAFDQCIHRLFQFNPQLNIIFTISPVRHIRDGVVDNNRSKARLLESVHHLCNKFGSLHYFPAYELVIDVLRDYRFFDVDMVHPNFQATRFVIDHFMARCVNESSVLLSKEVEKIAVARRHRPMQPDTDAHRKFLRLHAERTKALLDSHPYLALTEELEYFGQGHA